MINKDLLDAILKKYALKRGSFKLAGGQISDVYLDVKQAFLHPRAGPLIAAFMVRGITQLTTPPVCACVAGVPDAGTALAVAVSHHAVHHGRYWPALMLRHTIKDHGTQKHIEGDDNLTGGTHERNSACVLVEDVITSGRSVLGALSAICAHPRLIPRAVVAVVDREQGGIANILAATNGKLPGCNFPYQLEVIALTTLTAIMHAGNFNDFDEVKV